MDPLIIVFGLGVGLLVGLTGMGGGSLMTPLLILVFGITPVTAIGTDLAYGAVTKTVGGWRHIKLKTVDFGVATWMAFGSVPAAVGGVYALHAIEKTAGPKFDDGILIAVAAALFLTGLVMLGKTLLMPNAGGEREIVPATRRNKILAGVMGAAVGFVLGVTSAGSGSLIAVGLILGFRLAPQRVVGTDVVHAAVLLWAAAIAHIVAGNVDYGLAGTILLGSVPGVWIGSHMSVRVPAQSLRVVLGIVLLGAGLGLLSKAGANIPGPVIALFPVIIAGLVIRARIASRPAREAAAAAAMPVDPATTPVDPATTPVAPEPPVASSAAR